MQLHVGTSGYSDKEWKGPFYPEKLPPRDMLRFYAERLPAVEINNTFYRLPKASVLESWASQVPSGFRFAIKASRRITHFKRLKEADDETDYLLRTTAKLGERLGVVLFQLPPKLAKDLERLERFLAILPEGTRAAFEFRHDSWLDEEVCAALRRRNCALCLADTDEGPADGDGIAAGEPLLSTADWGYLRLRRPDYTREALAGWAERIRGTGWRDAFVFFKHEDEGAGPRMAADFIDASRLQTESAAR